MSRVISIRDREDYKRRMRDLLTLDSRMTVALTIDMQRDYLDREIATAPVRTDVAERVVSSTARMLDLCRANGIPVVHCYVRRRDFEARLGGHLAPYIEASNRAGLSQNLTAGPRRQVDRVAGSGNDEVVPALVKPGDIHMDAKRELDSFHLTDLDMILARYLKPDTVLIAGINTDTCVYATTFGASSRGYRPVLIEECVASMRGPDHHQMALELMSRTVAWVLSLAQLEAKLSSAQATVSPPAAFV